MLRSTFDRFLSAAGLVLAILLLVVSGLAFWGFSFSSNTVRDQLAAQRITMPTEQAMTGLSDADKAALLPFAGQPLDNGDAARAYADHYIQAHMNAAASGKTYAEVSSLCTAAKKTDPQQQQEATQTVCELRETLFMGDTLRSILLTAYAFGTIGKIAFWGFVTTLIGGLVMLALSIMGFVHAARAGDELIGAPPARALDSNGPVPPTS